MRTWRQFRQKVVKHSCDVAVLVCLLALAAYAAGCAGLQFGDCIASIEPSLRMIGQFVHADGEPFADLTVAIAVNPENPEREVSVENVTTDSEGRFDTLFPFGALSHFGACTTEVALIQQAEADPVGFIPRIASVSITRSAAPAFSISWGGDRLVRSDFRPWDKEVIDLGVILVVDPARGAGKGEPKSK